MSIITCLTILLFQQSDFVLSESALQMQKPKEHEKGAPKRSLAINDVYVSYSIVIDEASLEDDLTFVVGQFAQLQFELFDRAVSVLAAGSFAAAFRTLDHVGWNDGQFLFDRLHYIRNEDVVAVGKRQIP